MPIVNRRPTRSQRVLGAVVLAAFVAFGGSGCLPGMPFTACTAIGWSNHVEVIVEGRAAGDVARLALCTERGCIGPEATPAPTSGPFSFVTDLGSGRWRVELGFETPEDVSIEVFSADGITLGRESVDLEWQRVGGSEECGGPHQADPITVEVD